MIAVGNVTSLALAHAPTAQGGLAKSGWGPSQLCGLSLTGRHGSDMAMLGHAYTNAEIAETARRQITKTS